MKRLHALGATFLAAAGTLTTATPASATSVVGFGNATVGNACAEHGGPRADSTTRRGSGAASALGVALPIGGPANQCGSLGLPTALHEGFGVDAVGTLTGGEV
ncbi:MULTISPECIES: hypothetical protein [Streptomyces]|uniref:hypothetical protein n=1 Tax=Streptomyces TaxID=1883 RepID=UPI00163D240D|nr:MULTISPECIES: hypothetical protein [Streptomyces]MBC2878784.1 hypothetical protein [Streptomyces sp. TYQ1024]UBI39298.1 hypothetical protein K7I03_24450 [Streptomyces mobaraensis]UKW31879.1 hypothetical protein MCU78_24390 [Streptomyces sp. TYQ1024]